MKKTPKNNKEFSTSKKIDFSKKIVIKTNTVNKKHKAKKIDKTKTNKSVKSNNEHGKVIKANEGIVLSVDNVSMKFGNFTALDKVSFEIKKGESIGIIGANGAGKTTISEIIVGINKQTSGEIRYGFEYDKTPKEKVGMQFQDSSYPSGLKVKNIIKFARRIHGNKIPEKQIKQMMDVFQMRDFYNRRARSLSGGQRQKLNIFLSVIHKPELVILDELSTGLDISARKNIIQFTQKLLKENGISSILISHHMNEIRSLCKRVIVLSKGKVINISSIKKIEEEHKSLDLYMEKLINDVNKADIKASENKTYKL